MTMIFIPHTNFFEFGLLEFCYGSLKTSANSTLAFVKNYIIRENL